MKNNIRIDKIMTIKCLWITKSYKTVLNGKSLEDMQLLVLMSNKRL